MPHETMRELLDRSVTKSWKRFDTRVALDDEVLEAFKRKHPYVIFLNGIEDSRFSSMTLAAETAIYRFQARESIQVAIVDETYFPHIEYVLLRDRIGER